MNRQPNILLSFVLISTFVIADAQLANGEGFNTVRKRGFPDLFSALDNSNAYDLIPLGAEIQRIKSAQYQVIAGTNFKIIADVLVNGAVKPYCFRAFRSPQRDFSVENVKPGACK